MARLEGTCQSCGIRQGSMHSGSLECTACWDWRKLNGPAARYWVKAIDGLFTNDLGSGPDAIDYMQWDRWGIRHEMVQAMYTLAAARHAYQAEIDHWTAEREARWAKAK